MAALLLFSRLWRPLLLLPELLLARLDVLYEFRFRLLSFFLTDFSPVGL